MTTGEWQDELEPFIAEQKKDPVVGLAFIQEEVRDDIVAALYLRRRDLGLTQADIAEAIGVTQATVSEFESGRTDPRLSTLVRYAAAVKATLEIVMTPDSESEAAQ